MHYLVADIARTITLQPGDILLSGTPAISRTVYPGDVVEVEVEGSARSETTLSKGRPSPTTWCATHGVRRGPVDRQRRRLGVPRHPQARPVRYATDKMA